MADAQVQARTPDALTLEITDQLQQMFDARSQQAVAHGPEFLALWQLTAQSALGGKLLRPRLLIGTFDALTGGPSRPTDGRAVALELGAAIELLHFSFLLHDDLIDDDLIRRGVPNLIGHLAAGSDPAPTPTQRPALPGERRLHWARSGALLAGDLMLTIAHQVFARARLADDQRLRILDLLDAAVTETVAGEFCDVSLADGYLSAELSVVLDMTRMKTAAYTFELPLRVGAVVAGSPPETEVRLGQVGRHLGIAFQLQDDLLSAFECSDTHGKDQYSDFREGKETALIAYARGTESWSHIEPLLGAHDFTDDMGRAIQRRLTACGARQQVEAMAQDQISAALELLTRDDGVIPSGASRYLVELVEALDGRRV